MDRGAWLGSIAIALAFAVLAWTAYAIITLPR